MTSLGFSSGADDSSSGIFSDSATYSDGCSSFISLVVSSAAGGKDSSELTCSSGVLAAVWEDSCSTCCSGCGTEKLICFTNGMFESWLMRFHHL